MIKTNKKNVSIDVSTDVFALIVWALKVQGSNHTNVSGGVRKDVQPENANDLQ